MFSLTSIWLFIVKVCWTLIHHRCFNLTSSNFVWIRFDALKTLGIQSAFSLSLSPLAEWPPPPPPHKYPKGLFCRFCFRLSWSNDQSTTFLLLLLPSVPFSCCSSHCLCFKSVCFFSFPFPTCFVFEWSCVCFYWFFSLSLSPSLFPPHPLTIFFFSCFILFFFLIARFMLRKLSSSF